MAVNNAQLGDVYIVAGKVNCSDVSIEDTVQIHAKSDVRVSFSNDSLGMTLRASHIKFPEEFIATEVIAGDIFGKHGADPAPNNRLHISSSGKVIITKK